MPEAMSSRWATSAHVEVWGAVPFDEALRVEICVGHRDSRQPPGVDVAVVVGAGGVVVGVESVSAGCQPQVVAA